MKDFNAFRYQLYLECQTFLLFTNTSVETLCFCTRMILERMAQVLNLGYGRYVMGGEFNSNILRKLAKIHLAITAVP